MKNRKRIVVLAACAAFASAVPAGAINLPNMQVRIVAQQGCGILTSETISQIINSILAQKPSLPNIKPSDPGQKPSPDGDSVVTPDIPTTPNVKPGDSGQTPVPDGDTVETPNETPDSDTDMLASQAQQVVSLVNEERAKAGLPALTVDSKVQKAAQVRAREQATSFSHTRPNGSSYDTALKEAGATYAASGENIAYGQKTAQAVMQAWMGSSGHRANILSTRYQKIGVGYVEIGGQVYWTQLFTN